MKQHDVKSEKQIGCNRFFIRPFPAFTAANLSGEISSLIMPVLASLVPAAGKTGDSGDANIFNADAEAAAQTLANGLSAISGDRVEALLKKLMVKYRNISVELEGESEAQYLTEDLANDLFCGDTQDMFILAYEVIKVNYSGFFAKLGTIPFGNLLNAQIPKD